MTDDRSPRRIQSVGTAFEILKILRDRERATVTAVAEAIDRTLGTAHTYLATMREKGYVWEAGREYHVGLFILPLGEYVRANSRLYQAGKSEVDKLAQETGEAAHLAADSHGHEIPLYEQFGPDAAGENLYTLIKGYSRQNLHCSAASNAILAHLPQSCRDEILEHYELVSRTTNTITGEAARRDKFEHVRDVGYGINDEEQVSGVQAMAAPIAHKDTIYGVISLSTPMSWMPQDQFETTVLEQILAVANVIQINIQAPSGWVWATRPVRPMDERQSGRPLAHVSHVAIQIS